jgi:hypothetical protein
VPISALPEETVKALREGPVGQESMLEEADPASFPVAIAPDGMSFLPHQKVQTGPPFPFQKLIATIGASHQRAVHERAEDDSLASRAEFRTNWWRKAKANDVKIWTIQTSNAKKQFTINIGHNYLCFGFWFVLNLFLKTSEIETDAI